MGPLDTCLLISHAAPHYKPHEMIRADPWPWEYAALDTIGQ